MNSSQLLIRRSELEFLTPTPITVFAFSRSLETSGEKTESPLTMAQVRDLDHLERGGVHRRLELLVALPVAVRLLDHDRALEQQPLEDLFHVELRVLRLAHAERDVLEVAEHREATRFGGGRHPAAPRFVFSCGAGS